MKAQRHQLCGKRILILFGDLQMGGAERQGLLLARYLKEQEGALVEVWGLGPDRGPVADCCEEYAIPWRAVQVHWGLRRRLPHLLRLWYRLRAAAPDILMPYTRVPNVACGLLWRLVGSKAMVWNQADEGLLLSRSFLHTVAISMTPQFVVNSRAAQELFMDRFHVPESRIRFVKNGVTHGASLATRAAWRVRLAADNNRFVATMPANLTSFKDHATLLRAWRRVVDQFAVSGQPLPLLVLVGRLGDTAENVLSQVKELGLATTVSVYGYTEDVFGLLGASDICVYSSYSECYPNAVLEAMQAGLPVAASDIPGIRDTVGPDGADWLVPPGDAAACAAAILQLAADASLRRQVGALMQQRIRLEFSPDRMCREVVDVIQGTLSRVGK